MCGLVGFVLKFNPQPATVDLKALFQFAEQLSAIEQIDLTQMAEVEDLAQHCVLWGGFFQLHESES
ncbi:MAG: hypothetical protein P1V97_34670, partial [Planctomycetota bacterium]|nr:hypothetical protein [Planctomycetota bacterium]